MHALISRFEPTSSTTFRATCAAPLFPPRASRCAYLRSTWSPTRGGCTFAASPLASSLIRFRRNDRVREPRTLSLAIIAVYAGTKGAAVKFPSNCERGTGSRKGVVTRGRWRRVAEGEDDDAEERNRVRCSRENGTACLA